MTAQEFALIKQFMRGDCSEENEPATVRFHRALVLRAGVCPDQAAAARRLLTVRQTAGGFTSRGGSTEKSLEVFCVFVMVPRVLLHCGWFLYSRHPSCHGRGWRHVWC